MKKSIKITEDALIANYSGVSNGGDYIAEIDGRKYWWRYYGTDGYYVYRDRARADYIILTLDPIADNKLWVELSETPDLDKIQQIERDADRAFGGE